MSGEEELCSRCGRCCYKKVRFNGIAYFTNVPCKYLDIKTNLCTIYEKRYKVKDGCIPWRQAIKTRALPADCLYVKDIPGYVGPMPYFELAVIMSRLKKPRL